MNTAIITQTLIVIQIIITLIRIQIYIIIHGTTQQQFPPILIQLLIQQIKEIIALEEILQLLMMILLLTLIKEILA